MTGTTVVRALLAALGLAAAAYGVVLLLGQGTENLFETAKWLVGGVVLHDGVIGPGVVVLGFVAARLLGGRLPAPVVVGAVVLGSVTLVGLPVLGRYGARPDNPTLLPRDYTAGWLVLAGLTLAAVVIGLVLAHRAKDGGDGTRTGG